MKSLLVAALLICSVNGHTKGSTTVENDHFAPLLGSWLVSGRSLSPDGKTWTDNPHPALWRFYRILNGHAIQDDWTSPAPHIVDDKSTRTYGTNLRIFSTTKGHWEMTWIDSTRQVVLSFTATSTPDRIIMNSVGRNPPRRNIFDNLSPEGFSWRQEWTFDDGETWVPVSYLEASPWKDQNAKPEGDMVAP